MGPHPQPAGHDGGPQSPGEGRDAHPGGDHPGERRTAGGHALRPADRLRGERRNPYLALETVGPEEKAMANYVKSIDKGLLKTFSKMGISTLQSYRGAQVFEAIGLSKSLVEKYFTGTSSRIEGVGLEVLAQ